MYSTAATASQQETSDEKAARQDRQQAAQFWASDVGHTVQKYVVMALS